ncbi:transmembrane protein 128-like [Physella acuta]|uniref:transmembrane protein 128-like n=1 Tax=Physella acuta TaxID=109671 RepID=UPI0027DD2497|nr:transmembrane protein 128-like [Physella acuta]XP_059159330.1 transmembrane protein 128-like [Physella acuta]
MANYEEEVFHRRVQQKFSERFSNESTNDSNFNQNKNGSSGNPAAKQSPYCIQNFLWLGLAILVFYFSDFGKVVIYDQRIKGSWFWTGSFFMGLHASIAIFLIFWLSFWKKISSEEWENKYPRAVPIATAAFILGIICLSVSLWPVWGWLTPVILLILFMGGVVIIAMLG